MWAIGFFIFLIDDVELKGYRIDPSTWFCSKGLKAIKSMRGLIVGSIRAFGRRKMRLMRRRWKLFFLETGNSGNYQHLLWRIELKIALSSRGRTKIGQVITVHLLTLIIIANIDNLNIHAAIAKNHPRKIRNTPPQQHILTIISTIPSKIAAKK